MRAHTPEELLEARRSIASTLGKCEKSLLKLRPGTAQHTLSLFENRQNAGLGQIFLSGKAIGRRNPGLASAAKSAEARSFGPRLADFKSNQRSPDGKRCPKTAF